MTLEGEGESAGGLNQGDHPFYAQDRGEPEDTECPKFPVENNAVVIGKTVSS